MLCIHIITLILNKNMIHELGYYLIIKGDKFY